MIILGIRNWGLGIRKPLGGFLVGSLRKVISRFRGVIRGHLRSLEGFPSIATNDCAKRIMTASANDGYFRNRFVALFIQPHGLTFPPSHRAQSARSHFQPKVEA